MPKVFTAIAGGARTPEALAPVCAASVKGLRVLCDFLTISGFLTKDESGYAMTPDSELFLVEGSPAYMGGMASFLFHPFMEKGLANVTDAVRKGGTILPDRGSVSDDNPVWVNFARGMAPLTAPSAGVIARLAAGSGPIKVLDIAAGHGMFGITVAQHNPAADFGSGYDLVLVTNFIHHFDVPTNIALFEKTRAAMKPGAKMAIVEMAVNDDRLTPPGAGMFAMTMLTTTLSGDAFSQREIASMCASAGFHDVTHHSVPSTPQTVTIAVN